MENYSPSSWEKCNHTELLQVCQRAGIPVVPTYSKEQLIALLEGLEEPQQDQFNDFIVNMWRDAIMAFVIEYWARLRSQLVCPAKTGDPRACYGCVDAQVYACLVENEQMQPFIKKQLIELKRKKTT